MQQMVTKLQASIFLLERQPIESNVRICAAQSDPVPHSW